MKRKILITGISSAIMQRFVQKINLSEFEVVGISRTPDLVKLDNISIVKGDLSHSGEMKHLLEGCYMVIHGAAITHSRSKKEYFRVNLESTKDLVDYSVEFGIKRFVFISSNAAGTESGSYGESKLMAEEYIQNNFTGWSVFRLSEVYGGDKNEGIEKLIGSVLDSSFVPCPLNIPSKFYPVDIDDTARILYERIFESDYLDRISSIHGPDGYSYLEIIELVKKLSGNNPRVVFLNRNIMYFLKLVTRVIPFNFGMVPDQVDRLYSIKTTEKPPEHSQPLRSLRSYVEARVNMR